MNKTNGGTGAPLGVLAEITALLADITPEQYVVPRLAREAGANVVAHAADHIKRLFTLRSRLAERIQNLASIVNQASDNALAMLGRLGPAEAIAQMGKDGSPFHSAYHHSQKTVVELKRAECLAEVMNNIFWLEVRRQHPDLECKPVISIYSDWSLGWKNDDDDGRMGINFVAIGSDQVADLAKALGKYWHPH